MMLIRRAAPADVSRMVELWTEMWEEHRRLDPRFSMSPMASLVVRHWIEGNLEAAHSAVFVAEAGPAVVGYLVAAIMENLPVVETPAFGFVSEIAVTASHRRRGIGAQLVEAAHSWFKSQRIDSVEVNASIRNEASRAFWRKLGYGEFLERLQRRIG